MIGLWLLAATGCDLAPGDSTDSWDSPSTDSGSDTTLDPATDTDTDTDTSPAIQVAWDVEGVTVTIGSGASYRLGMVEVELGGWRGEDCAGGEAGFHYCHTLGSSQVRLESVGSPFDVLPGRTTLFDQNQEPGITYYLARPEGDCWTWGQDPSYYTAKGCREVAAP